MNFWLRFFGLVIDYGCLIVGFFSMAIMNATQTLILDLVPDQGSSVTACVRLCSLFFSLFHPFTGRINELKSFSEQPHPLRPQRDHGSSHSAHPHRAGGGVDLCVVGRDVCGGVAAGVCGHVDWAKMEGEEGKPEQKSERGGEKGMRGFFTGQ